MSRDIAIIEVKESKEELQKALIGCRASLRPRIKMLLLVPKGGLSNTVLSAKVGVNRNRIAAWKQLYKSHGLSGLLQERRGGNRKGAINKEVHRQIRERLSDPKGGFTSYKGAQEWINQTFGLEMKYKTVNQYLHYHFQSKLKVARKSHLHKDAVQAEAFKKGTAR